MARPAHPRSLGLRRWAAVGALVLVALLYYRPVKAWLDARGELAQRSAVVHRLQAERSRLQARLGASTSLAALSREARQLGYVRPGEHLFIVRDINAWRRRNRQAAHRP